MSSVDANRSWEDRMKEAAERAQEELRRLVQFIDGDVVPEVRRNSSSALRAAAEQMQKLAQRLDEAAASHHEPPRDHQAGER